MTAKNAQPLLDAMCFIEELSSELHTLSWIWGGLAVDVHSGRFLRKHADLDYLSLDLHAAKRSWRSRLAAEGWQVRDLENGDLQAENGSIQVQLGHVEFTTRARWTHAGEKGSLFFPCGWLPQAPVRFYGLDLHVVAVEFQYVVKKRPDLLNPAWTPRRRDRLDLRRLEELLLRKGVEPSGLLSQITAA